MRGRLIPARVIKRLVAESPAYQKTEFCLFTLRYSSLTTLIEDIKFKRPSSRILEYLSSFDTEEIAVKNSDMAEHLGASQNVINRVLQDLKDKNLTKLGRVKIKLIERNLTRSNLTLSVNLNRSKFMKKPVSILAFAAAMCMAGIAEGKLNPADAEIYESACNNGGAKGCARLGRFTTTAKK